MAVRRWEGQCEAGEHKSVLKAQRLRDTGCCRRAHSVEMTGGDRRKHRRAVRPLGSWKERGQKPKHRRTALTCVETGQRLECKNQAAGPGTSRKRLWEVPLEGRAGKGDWDTRESGVLGRQRSAGP